MDNESSKSRVCGCRNNSTSKVTLYRLSYIILLLFTYTSAQASITAQLTGSASKDKASEYAEKFIQKGPGYFWEQTRQNINEKEQFYYETGDYAGIGPDEYQGGFGDRDPKDEEYYVYYGEPEPENEKDNRFYDHEPQYEPDQDRESSEYHAGTGQPCAGGKMCAHREESREIMIHAIKRNILQQLKMTNPPNITVPKIPYDSPPIRKLFQKYGIKEDPVLRDWELEHEDTEYEDDPTKREKVISYARELPFPGQTGSYFKFTEEDLRYSVTSAVIWFYVKHNPTSRTNITLDFYRYQKNATHPDAPPIAVKFNKKVVHLRDRKDHWKSFSISAEVSRWFINPKSNLGIDIRCVEIPEIIISQAIPGQEDKKPTLDVDLADSSVRRRRKRSDGSLVCNENSREPRCCKYDFEINFRSMGWDWIISPNVYRSYYCAGDCPLLFIQSNQNKMLQMQNMRPKATTACCAPTQMESMSMLYFDNEHNIIYSDVPDMIVKKCGCM